MGVAMEHAFSPTYDFPIIGSRTLNKHLFIDIIMSAAASIIAYWPLCEVKSHLPLAKFPVKFHPSSRHVIVPLSKGSMMKRYMHESFPYS